MKPGRLTGRDLRRLILDPKGWRFTAESQRFRWIPRATYTRYGDGCEGIHLWVARLHILLERGPCVEEGA